MSRLLVSDKLRHVHAFLIESYRVGYAPLIIVLRKEFYNEILDYSGRIKNDAILVTDATLTKLFGLYIIVAPINVPYKVISARRY